MRVLLDVISLPQQAVCGCSSQQLSGTGDGHGWLDPLVSRGSMEPLDGCISGAIAMHDFRTGNWVILADGSVRPCRSDSVARNLCQGPLTDLCPRDFATAWVQVVVNQGSVLLDPPRWLVALVSASSSLPQLEGYDDL